MAVEVGEHLEGGRRGGEQAGDRGAAGRGVAGGELGREPGPPRIGVPAVQVAAAQAARGARDDQRADDAGLAPHGRDQVGHAGALEAGDERVGGGPRPGEDDEVGARALAAAAAGR